MKVHSKSLMVMLVLLMTGCTSAGSSSGASDPWGEVEVRRIETIQIGVVVPSTGEVMTAAGNDVVRGVELAIADNGRILGYAVEAVPIFTQCSAGGGRSSALSLATDQDMVAIIGPICSTACEAAVPIFDEAHLTAVSPGCGASALADQALHNQAFLRTLYDDRHEGEAAARFAYLELGMRRAITIGDGTIETGDVIAAFASSFQQLGGEIVAAETVVSGETNFRTQLGDIAEAAPDIIFAPLLPDDAVTLTVQKAGTAAADIPLLGGRHYHNSEFVQQAGTASDGVYAVSPYVTSNGVADLAAAYEQTYQEPPASQHYLFAYDAAQLILTAIAEASHTEAGATLIIGRQALRDALYDTTMYDGLTGSITCSAYGDCSAPSLAVYFLRGSDWELSYIP